MTKEIIFEINGKEIRLTELEALELKKDLDKMFPATTCPVYPAYPQKWDEPFPKIVWGDNTAPKTFLPTLGTSRTGKICNQ